MIYSAVGFSSGASFLVSEPSVTSPPSSVANSPSSPSNSSSSSSSSIANLAVLTPTITELSGAKNSHSAVFKSFI